MKITALVDLIFNAALALQDMAFCMRPLVGIVLLALSMMMIMFGTRYFSEDAA
jgi:hypothetical protein